MTEIELEQTFKMGKAKNIGRVLIAIFFIGIILYVLTMININVANMDRQGAFLDVSSLGPCASEDSDNCFWDAGLRSENGNGQGQSFFNIDGVTYYLAK